MRNREEEGAHCPPFGVIFGGIIPEFQESVLDHVIGEGSVPNYSSGDGLDRPTMFGKKLLKGGLIARLDPIDQKPIAVIHRQV